eukprot:gene2860-3554_t
MNKISILLVLSLIASISLGQNTVQFSADVSNTNDWEHYWERSVGSGHAWLGTRQDWREALQIAREKLGFERVRFHGVFDDDMNVYQEGPNGEAVYSWYNVDYVYDYIVSLGMQPIVELSFMPSQMASGNATIFHYKGNITPPKNYTLWNNLITNFMQHLIDRYGMDEISTWFFEVWNEPNCGFWTGTQSQYYQLLQETFNAIKSVSPLLNVGGPATCQSQWLNDTLAFTEQAGFKLDFISTHEYPTDIQPLTRGVMKNVLTNSRSIVGPDMPLFYTEFNDGLFAQSLHDNTYASAFAVFNIIDCYGIADIFSWWTFTDVFEEGGQQSVPFNQGFGLQTIYNIPKPSFKAFELLHETSNKAAVVSGSHPTAGVLVTVSNKETMVIVYNHNIPDAPIQTETVTVQLNNLQSTNFKSSTIRRIDDDNCNPIATWQQLGSPTYPTPSQIKTILASAEFNEQSYPFKTIDNNTIQLVVDVPPQGVAAFKLKY